VHRGIGEKFSEFLGKLGTLYDLHLLGVLAHEWEPLWQKYVRTGSLK
jgi:hypothetical protein